MMTMPGLSVVSLRGCQGSLPGNSGAEPSPKAGSELQCKKSHRQPDDCGCVPIKLYLWTMKFEFLIHFVVHEMLFFF